MTVDLERKLLGRMLSSDEIGRIWELGLRPEVFETPLCQAVFNFSVDYWLSTGMKSAPTSMVLQYEFPGVDIQSDAEESTLWLVEELQRRYATNQLQEMLRDAAVKSVEDPFGTLKELWANAHSASETVAPRYGRVNMATTVEQRRQRYGYRMDTGGQGVTLGLPELDQHSNGLLPGELCAVGAFSKVGKTVWLINAAVQARRQGLVPVIFTLEMAIPEIEDRVDAFFSGVSYDRLTHGSLTQAERRQLNDAQDEMASLGPLYVEQPERGNRTVRNLVNRARQLGANYLIVDQLSFIDAEKDYYRGDKAITSKHTDIIFSLKDEISRQSSGALPCMLAVQLNRASQNQSRIELQNFANTSAIEQTVDLALGLSRTREERNNNVMRLDILGARRSDIKAWLLSWHLRQRTSIAVRQEV